MFRNLLMGFEIPFRAYVANVILSKYRNEEEFGKILQAKSTSLQASAPLFLKNTLPKESQPSKIHKNYEMLKHAAVKTQIVSEDSDIPSVGMLNWLTFSLIDDFGDLYACFKSYSDYCNLAEKYRYARNKLDHPRCRTLEESHLVPVLSFVKDICSFLDDQYFLEKTKDVITKEILALQQRKISIPISKHNITEMPYGESKLVCRDKEIEMIKKFLYGNPGDLRKQHSMCIYGYGGVGKTALVLEVVKQVVQDLLDNTTANDYQPEYLFFFSAKKRSLALAQTTGKIIERTQRCHFDTADDLIALIYSSLEKSDFAKFHGEGLIIIDNLETLSDTERKKVKAFIEHKTPEEMQFIITSRHSEEYDCNYKLTGFEFEAGNEFIQNYSNENELELSLSDSEISDLLSLAKGNTLVLVLCLRRLSQQLVNVNHLRAEFSGSSAFSRIKKGLQQIPPNAYEVIGEFMFKDTFEQIEEIFSSYTELFYQILRVFAIIPTEEIDISTICLLTRNPYPQVELVVETLCNYLILEKKKGNYSLNSFAEKYIIRRFVPDAELYTKLFTEITSRMHEIQSALKQLELDKKQRPELAKILTDWSIITNGDLVTAAKMYQLYQDVKWECERASKYHLSCTLETFMKECQEAESITAHPYIKYQKARILQLIDQSQVLPDKHPHEIFTAFNDAIYVIQTVEQYSSIQQTKSYASMLWLFGQQLEQTEEYSTVIRYLEESKNAFEQLAIEDQEYYQCCTKLGHIYLKYYEADRDSRVAYLRRSRYISRMLQQHYDDLGKARRYAIQLKNMLIPYGKY